MRRVLLSLTLLVAASTYAEEGMWPLDQLGDISWGDLMLKGISVKPDKIRELARAVVRFPGATGAFVSAEGLVLTNHHVAFGCVASNSSVERNFAKDGFLAATREQELPCQGVELQLLRESKDVTAEVIRPEDAAISDPFKLYEERDKRRNALASSCQAGRDDRRCQVAQFFGGAKQVLISYDLLRDIRLVHAPEQALGDFGGDVDNFEWPRHTADYSLVRAYVGPDGHARPFDKGNVPFHPPVVLTISVDGYVEHDGNFAIGYPGFTQRHISAAQLDYTAAVLLPNNLERLRSTRRVLTHWSESDPKTALLLVDSLDSINNNEKRAGGNSEALQRASLLAAREQRDKDLEAFLAADPALAAQFGGVTKQLRELTARWRERLPLRLFYQSLDQARGLNQAYELFQFAVEKGKPDEQRIDGYHERQKAGLRVRIVDNPRKYVAPVEADLLVAAFEKGIQLPESLQIVALGSRIKAQSGAIDERLRAIAQALAGATKVGDPETRRRWYDLDEKGLRAETDPMMKFAVDLFERRRAFEDNERQQITAPLEEQTRRYARALKAWKGAALPPDANGTLRFSWGSVEGYYPLPRGSRRSWATTIGTLVATATQRSEYQTSDQVWAQLTGARLPRLVDPLLRDTPVNFLSTMDTTGGNSGSPTFDGRGRLIGVAFDGNYEGLGNSYFYDPDQQRSIVVDIRFVLDLMLRVYGAESLVREMKVNLY